MQECVQRVAAKSGIHYSSKSNPDGKGYKAYAWRDDALPMCTCMPFLRGRKKEAERLGLANNEVAFTCGHLTDLMENSCHWRQATEADYQFDGRCPACGAPVVDGDEIPDFDDADAIADLLEMARELAPTEDAPAPAAPTGKNKDVAALLIAQARGK